MTAAPAIRHRGTDELASRTPLVRRFADLFLAIAIVATVDAVLFHAGVYVRWLKPESYSGRVEATARRFAWSIAHRPGTRHVVLIGDSTTVSAMNEEVLDARFRAAGIPLRAMSLAEGGSTANVWLPLLRNQPVHRETTAVVVFGIFVPAFAARQTRPDTEIAKTRMTIADGLQLAAAYGRRELQLQVASASVFRLPWFREDVRDLLASPRRRQREIAASTARERERIALPRRTPPARNIASVRADGTTVSFEAAEPWIRNDATIRTHIERRYARQQSIRRKLASSCPRADPGYLRSFAAVVRLLHARGVDVVWAVVPEAPFPTGNRSLGDIGELRDRLRAEGIPVALFHDVGLLAELEQPSYYADAWHVNADGSRRYSDALGRFLVARLRGDRAGLSQEAPLHAGSH